MMRKISRTISGARPRLGSSSISRSRPAISARPIASICRSPPESVPACLRRRSRQPRKQRVHLVQPRCGARRPSRGTGTRRAANCPRTVMLANSSRFSGTRQMPAPHPRLDRPSPRMSLAAETRPRPRAGSTPMIAFSSVRLARAVRADHGDDLARRDLQADTPCTAPTAAIARPRDPRTSAPRSRDAAEIGFDHGRVGADRGGQALRRAWCRNP